MRIVLMATGTRGDVQPMLGLGKALRDAGHTIRVVAGSNFESWITSHGLEAYPTIDVETLMRSEQGVKWVESRSQFEQLRSMQRLQDQMLEPTVSDALQSTEGAELIIGGFVSEPLMQAVSEKRGVPLVSAALQPYRATRSGAATLVPLLPRSDSRFNHWMGLVASSLTWSMLNKKGVSILRQRLGLPQHSLRSYLRATHTIPALYAISPTVVPPTDDPNVRTTGYWFLDEAFTPSDDLTRFINAGAAPVYIGFGSMSSSAPERTIEIVAQALARVGRRGILATGWSGALPHAIPDHVFVLDKAPHTWLFPQVAAVVHHGGAGTTAAGLRAGKPTLIVPHMADQPYWARRVYELGVGPKPLQRHELAVNTLTERLSALVNTPTIRERAATLGARIRAEQGIENAVQWLETYMAQPPT